MSRQVTTLDGSIAVQGKDNGHNPGSFLEIAPEMIVRPSFTYLAGAYPSAKVDEEYWAVLEIEFRETPEPILHQAIRQYIRTNDNAYRMPTVAELLRLCGKAEEAAKAEEEASQDIEREAFQQQEYEAIQSGLKKVLRSVPEADRKELRRRMTAAYEQAGSWVEANRIIFTYLVDTADAPHAGWYCPTELAAAIVRKSLDDEFDLPLGDMNADLDGELVSRLTAEFQGKFRVSYQPDLEDFLDPDRYSAI